MKEQDDELEKVFRERFSEEEAPISPIVWDKVKASLPSQQVKPTFGYLKKWVILSLGVVVLSLVALVFLVNKKEVSSPIENNSITISSDVERKQIDSNKNKTGLSQDLSTTTDKLSTNTAHANISDKKGTQELTSKKPSGISLYQDKKNENRGIEDKQNAVSKSTFSNSRKNDNVINNIPNKKTSMSNLEGESKTNLPKTIANANKKSTASSSNTVAAKDKTDAMKNVSNEENFTRIETNDAQIKTTDAQLKPNENLVSSKNNRERDKENFLKSATKTSVVDSIPNVLPVTSNTIYSKENNVKDSVSFLPENTKNSDTLLSTKENVPEKDSTTVASQDSTSVSKDTAKTQNNRKKLQRWSVDVLLSPSITGANTTANNDMYTTAVTEKNKEDKNKMGYSFGTSINYSISPRLFFSTGAFYTSLAEQSKYKEITSTANTVQIPKTIVIFIQDTANTSRDSTYFVDSTYTTRTERSSTKRDSYSILSIPLSVSYVFLQNKKLALSVTGGVRLTILTKGITHLSNQDRSAIETFDKNFKTMSFAYLASLALEYKATEHLSLLLQPSFSYNINSIYNKSGAITQRPFVYGLNVGVRIRF